MAKFPAAVLLLGFIMLPAAAARAQGSIAEVVTDSSGAALPGVRVEAASAVLIEKVRSVLTDSAGQYRIIDLRPGTYAVTFSSLGSACASMQKGRRRDRARKREAKHPFGPWAAPRTTYPERRLFVQRFYYKSLRGWPAIGILLIRVAAAVTIAYRSPPAHVVEHAAAVLLFGGLWTAAAATVVAAFECWRTVFDSGGWVSLLLTAMTLAVALIGAGTWSLDARIVGWRRIDIPMQKSERDARSG
jgi:hypothetical protein